MTTAAATQVHGTVAYLAGHLTLWQYHGQLPALDCYLRKVAVRRQTGSLPQYQEFRDVVKEAALLLRASPAVPIAGPAGAPAVAPFADPEPWECPGCHCLLERPGTKHEPCDIPVVAGAITSPQRISSTVAIIAPAPADEPPYGPLDEANERRAAVVFGEVKQAPQAPGPAAGPPDAAGPGSSEDESAPGEGGGVMSVNDERECPQHGKTLGYHEDQDSDLGEHEWREHLECQAEGCGYEVWA